MSYMKDNHAVGEGGRQSGVLLHPTSLPGFRGIGTLGREALRFVESLEEMGQGIWQVLPLSPVDAGGSPYSSPSGSAISPLLLDFEMLREDGIIKEYELPHMVEGGMDYREVFRQSSVMTATVCAGFDGCAGAELRAEFDEFCCQNAGWLDDHSIFTVLKARFCGRSWIEWPPELARRQTGALATVTRDCADDIKGEKMLQFLLHKQWQRIREHAVAHGVSLFGDLPIYAALDSVDVWAHPELFKLDADGHPLMMAGVPPDYFSETGQLWGNPVYRWDAHIETGFEWWLGRLERALELFDILRIDHFRGFESCWEVPAGEVTAVNGNWVKVPGAQLFKLAVERFGSDSFVAEDLGVITDEVLALRDRFGLPGMRILQFELEGDDALAVEAYPENTVVYTGTHDNDTVRGWFAGEQARESSAFQRVRDMGLLDDGEENLHWKMIEFGMRSSARIFIAPLQDVMGLGSDARMNTPGTTAGNWRWRFTQEMLTEEMKERMRGLARRHGRSETELL